MAREAWGSNGGACLPGFLEAFASMPKMEEGGHKWRKEENLKKDCSDLSSHFLYIIE
jgi:hypothetical protein